ncbi:MAG: hypothetical protein KGZ83_04860 [Sulfuricella sp.]|nr:hypothetical protein [Sulfuricella sp.]
MSNLDNVFNLLVDPESGNIYHVSSLAQTCFGFSPEQLRGMNFSGIFHQPLKEIISDVHHAGYLKEVTLQMHESISPSATKAYASLMKIDNRAMLFVCVYGAQPLRACGESAA